MRELKPLLGLDDLNKHSRYLLNIRTTDCHGREEIFSFGQAETIKCVKEKILGEKFSRDFAHYKLIQVRNKVILEDVRTLEQERVEDNDELVLWKKRREGTTSVGSLRKVSLPAKSPDLPTVKLLTENVGPEQGQSANYSVGLPVLFDFFGELKRILTSLVEVASLLQFVSSEDKDDSDMDIDESEIRIDPVCLQKLMDMGFSEERAKKALIMNRMSPMQAMDWLLQNETDPSIDEPLTYDQLMSYLPERKRRERRTGKREFVPNPRAVHNLRDMGFEEKDIVEALKVTGNHQDAALEWLLGDRQSRGDTADGGLDPASPIYKAIMEHPVVQLGMTNPRILHAFEDMLENPNTSAQYINDPEIGPVLLQISRTVQSFPR